jgi:hypothetical protein
MNILYTITWPESETGDAPRQFFNQIRESVARGASFPFDCPYEIALVQPSKTPDATRPRPEWAVAILAMRVTTSEIGASENTLPQLRTWLAGCIPSTIPADAVYQSSEASHLKLASELGRDYNIVANFGTFVGEPEMERPAEPAKPKPSISPETEALKALVGQPLSAEAQKVLGSPPQSERNGPGNTAAPAAQPAISDKVRACLTIGLLVSGVLLIPVSLVLGALLAFGEFTPDPSTGASSGSTAEFIQYVACCPLPVLILGIGLIFLGIFLPRWLKETQSLPVNQPKG